MPINEPGLRTYKIGWFRAFSRYIHHTLRRLGYATFLEGILNIVGGLVGEFLMNTSPNFAFLDMKLLFWKMSYPHQQANMLNPKMGVIWVDASPEFSFGGHFQATAVSFQECIWSPSGGKKMVMNPMVESLNGNLRGPKPMPPPPRNEALLREYYTSQN